jgi:hypothetical protein
MRTGQTDTLHDLRDGGESCLFDIYCMINTLLNLLQWEDSHWRASVVNTDILISTFVVLN